MLEVAAGIKKASFRHSGLCGASSEAVDALISAIPQGFTLQTRSRFKTSNLNQKTRFWKFETLTLEICYHNQMSMGGNYLKRINLSIMVGVLVDDNHNEMTAAP
jgi:hypothetical protein